MSNRDDSARHAEPDQTETNRTLAVLLEIVNPLGNREAHLQTVVWLLSYAKAMGQSSELPTPSGALPWPAAGRHRLGSGVPAISQRHRVHDNHRLAGSAVTCQGVGGQQTLQIRCAGSATRFAFPAAPFGTTPRATPPSEASGLARPAFGRSPAATLLSALPSGAVLSPGQLPRPGVRRRCGRG